MVNVLRPRVLYICVLWNLPTSGCGHTRVCISEYFVREYFANITHSSSLSLFFSLSFAGHCQYFFETPPRSLSLPRPMHKHGADKHTVGMYLVFYFTPTEICCSYLRFVYPEKSRNRRAFQLMNKKRYLSGLRAEVQERMRVLAGLLPPTPGPSHAGGNIISLSALMLFLARRFVN